MDGHRREQPQAPRANPAPPPLGARLVSWSPLSLLQQPGPEGAAVVLVDGQLDTKGLTPELCPKQASSGRRREGDPCPAGGGRGKTLVLGGGAPRVREGRECPPRPGTALLAFILRQRQRAAASPACCHLGHWHELCVSFTGMHFPRELQSPSLHSLQIFTQKLPSLEDLSYLSFIIF